MASEEFSVDLLQLYYGTLAVMRVVACSIRLSSQQRELTNHFCGCRFGTDRLFPYEQMARWLTYDGGEEFFFRRELSFTLENDTYIRYKSFHNAEEMKVSMTKTLPFKIDIGAVFSVSPADKGKVNASDFVPEERELVFDIDLTDYDDIRTCCEGASICAKCWQFMIAAVKVMDAALREDFGYEHIMWVYSGRRGIHCWVSDESARQLTNEARTAVVQYLSLVEGNENSKRKVHLKDPLHPSLDRAYRLLEPLFEDIILGPDGQGIFCDEKQWAKLLNMVPDEDLRSQLNARWSAPSNDSTPREKWLELVDGVEKILAKGQPNSKRPHNDSRKRNLLELRTCLPEIVLAYLYPRLDANVSKQRNHLLKSPFAVHPKTGRVCVPVDAEAIEDFDPFTVPTLGQLQDELNKVSVKDAAALGAEKTSMNEYVRLFETQLLKPLDAAAKQKQREAKESNAAFNGDW